MTLGTRLARIEKALEPQQGNPLFSLAARMRVRQGKPIQPVLNPEPGSLAHRMQQRASRQRAIT